jgi:hypothetical protein
MECPYSVAVWRHLGVDPSNILNIIDCELSVPEFEIRAEIISVLVFCKNIIPPDILVRLTLQAYANKLCRRLKTVQVANTALLGLT